MLDKFRSKDRQQQKEEKNRLASPVLPNDTVVVRIPNSARDPKAKRKLRSREARVQTAVQV